jgi:hypothetical protein
MDWKTCDDGIACTNDGCDGATGVCVNAADDAACGDGNLCTDDKCDGVMGCVNEDKVCNSELDEECWGETGGCVPTKNAQFNFWVEGSPGNIFWESRFINGKLAHVHHNSNAAIGCPVQTGPCVISISQENNLSSIDISEQEGKNGYFSVYNGPCLLGLLPEGPMDVGEIVAILQTSEPETVNKTTVSNTIPGNCVTVQVNQF